MMNFELDKFIGKAAEYFPKTGAHELRLLRKLVSSIELATADDILDDVKMRTKFLTLPLPDIAKKVKSISRTFLGEYIDCWALHRDKAKWINCAVYVQSHDFGHDSAKYLFAQYLSQYNHDPTDYILYIGHESFDQFFWARFEKQCEEDPEIRESAKFLLQSAKGVRGIVDAVADKKDIPIKKESFTDDEIPF